VPAVRTPFSVQPAVVLMSLFDAVSARYQTDSAHLWLEDSGTATLRLVAAFGPRVPKSDPLQMNDVVLGQCAATRSAVFAVLPIDPSRPEGPAVWRYAVPVGTPEVRGVAGVDLVPTDHDGAAFILNEVSAALRASLTAALAVHVARSEMDTAVLLLKAAQELTSGMGGDDILSSALESAMQLAGATTGSVMLPQGPDGALRIVASRGLSADVVANASVARGEGIAGTVYSTDSPLLIEDLPGRAGERRHGVQSAVSIPISDESGTLGVLNVGARAFPARLTDAYVRALGLLGSQTATAMRNVRAAERSWDSYLDNLLALATALEFDDPYRRGASRRIAELTVALGEAMTLESDDLVSLRIAAILHDVGMGMATGSVGSTDRPLSTVDRGLVRAHPKVAYDVMQQVPSLESLAPVVRHHHERFDGDGYDTGLSGSSIPLGSRVLAVADAFVAMTSARPYREALSVEAALAELNAGAGAQFDPEVVEAFIALLSKRPDLAAPA
jgi:HD-GYP domain-containing protein (c-di-GMP phosphodiesterase class II)